MKIEETKIYKVVAKNVEKFLVKEGLLKEWKSYDRKAVMTAQELLKQLYKTDVKVDGVVGPQTKQLMKRFQQDNMKDASFVQKNLGSEFYRRLKDAVGKINQPEQALQQRQADALKSADSNPFANAKNDTISAGKQRDQLGKRNIDPQKTSVSPEVHTDITSGKHKLGTPEPVSDAEKLGRKYVEDATPGQHGRTRLHAQMDEKKSPQRKK